jgi:ankyrin repeat protein
LRHGANANATSHNNGATPLHYAAGRGSLEMVELLLASGGRADISDKAGWIPYRTANSKRHDQVARVLRDLAVK